MEIPQQDEVLRTLVGRFKEAPSSNAFVELASALLARGHAAEALSITDHGLMLVPENVEGRVERAAALLALGRPRVAYVELLRALAIHPGHRRTMRLLGRAFVDAGTPGRAAELLARRSADPIPVDGKASDLPLERTSKPRDENLPALFSALTRDLGLGSAVPETETLRVEVTQIMRKRGMPRPPRSKSELASIEGPIVDTSQTSPHDRASDFDEPTVPTPRLEDAHLAFSMDDEPLFQEHMPFSIHPVDSDSSPAQPCLPGGSEFGGRRRMADPREPTLPVAREPPALRSLSSPRGRSAALDLSEPSPEPTFEIARPGPRWLILFTLGVMFMLLYLGTLAYLSAEELKAWLGVLPLPW